MIKKLFIVTIIFLSLLTPVSSFAMEVTVPGIGSVADLGYSLFGGSEYDFTGSQYTIENYINMTQAEREQEAEIQARKFVAAYAISRGIPVPYWEDDPELPSSDIKGYFKSTYFNNSVRTALSNYKLAQDVTAQDAALRFPIGPQAFADWASYSRFWYKTYLDQVGEDSDIVVPVVPSEYSSIVGVINSDSGLGNDFFWKSYNLTFEDYSRATLMGSIDSFSYVGATGGTIYSSAFKTNSIKATEPITINVIGSNDSYSFSVRVNYTAFADTHSGTYHYIQNFYLNNSVATVSSRTNAISNGTWDYSRSGTLTDVLTYISSRFRNINLYVNFEPWTLISNPAPANPVIPSFPDIIDPDSDEPAYDIVFPNTSDYEGTFDLTSIFDAVKEAIIGASDNDDTTSGILTREGVTDGVRDKEGELVGTAERSIDVTLDDSFPIQGTLNYPNIPIFDEPIHNAFAGTTILAQLINAVDIVLPDPLMLVFWGILFILFIIGLIKILHK